MFFLIRTVLRMYAGVKTLRYPLSAEFFEVITCRVAEFNTVLYLHTRNGNIYFISTTDLWPRQLSYLFPTKSNDQRYSIIYIIRTQNMITEN